ncbi:hypothetical protein D9758_001718 [Tetrapyrgos nigripes]|uniref:Uncharacterized protein n=1 Tax=Tetrapyrgos nigripes TaxID=182062 RepID=A0A8H5GXH9_9AGAR|nr:hypothetical protein D9758_001718 [Tetrapyrgos nigripes]
MAEGLWDECGESYRRLLGDSEYSYFPASQNNGVGDMFLHLAFRASVALIQEDRVAIAWAVIRSRHPLLVSTVTIDAEHPNRAFFNFCPPGTKEDAISEARKALTFTNQSEEELIHDYMNGPRTLSNDHLSTLVISTPRQAKNSSAQETTHYDLLMCAPHFAGDGSSLHQCSHELLALIASQLPDAQLSEEIRFGAVSWKDVLPPALETRLPVPQSPLAKAASKINYAQTLRKEVGGHVFARSQRGPQRTISVEKAFTEAETASILRNCKSQQVTINHALFVLCNFAWNSCNNLHHSEGSRLPLMMYTAINLRPYLSPHAASTYWFLALTYFNIVLPSFLPQDNYNKVFWHRARSVKAQTRKAVVSPFLTARALEGARTRASRARGISVSVPGMDVIENKSESSSEALTEPAPSLALMGLSLIGNLDVTYAREEYPSIELLSVRTASRQKPGGLLLLEHTFGKKLWLQLFWDEKGFKEGQIEKFWECLQNTVHGFLI